MRRVVYSVAASLDGFIAGPEGRYDWIPADPDIDFGAVYARFDALLMGRGTYEVTRAAEGAPAPDMDIYVFSTTLDPAEHPDVTVVSGDVERAVRELKAGEGKDIWLFGGGVLFRSLLDAGLVDGVQVAVIGVLLGGGVPLLPPPARTRTLRLENHRVYEKTGTVWLEYAVDYASR